MGWVSGAAVVAGAMLGGPLRYLSDWCWQTCQGRTPSQAPPFPWPTLVVNLVGSLLFGVIIGAGWQGLLAAGLGAGFCGALTTYSTFSFEVLSLMLKGAGGRAFIYVAVTLTAGLAAAAAGVALGQTLR